MPMMRFMHSHGLTRISAILLVVALGACSKPPTQRAKGDLTGTPQAAPPTAGSRGPVASTRPESTATNGGAPGPSRRYTFAPDAPLPAPAAVSSGPEEERALLLARQVLAGGEGARAALVAALQQAGFPIRDAAGTILVRPVGKSQGITFELWEVNALAESIANRERMFVPLDNFAEMIAAPLPELRDAPMTDFVLDGVRTRALDPDGSLLFWAVFIAELGRQDKVREPYDILLDIDPAKNQLDMLQLAFITKRIAADLAVLAYPDKVGKKQGFSLPSWPVRTAYAADLPCEFEGVLSEIREWEALGAAVAFDELMDYLRGIGIDDAEKLSKIGALADVLLAYIKLAAAQAAFDMRIEMRDGTPLVRTQKQRPVTGETKTLVAALTMDMGKAQWVNCFRTLFNQLGLDFTVEKDGPIKDASVAWTGESGFFGQLVQFVGDPKSRFEITGRMSSPILDARTDASGIATVNVEGVGQRDDLGDNPKPVMKEATVSAMAVLKPANMYRDFKDAASTAQAGLAGLLAMPAELMYRTHWSFGAAYTFPVKDWKPRAKTWSGVITDTLVKLQIQGKKINSKCCGGRPIMSKQRETVLETIEQRWTLTSDAYDQAPSSTMLISKASYSVTAERNSKVMFYRTGWNSCKSGRQATWSRNTVTEDASASSGGETEVNISLDANSHFSVVVYTPEELPRGEGNYKSLMEYGPACGARSPNVTVTRKSHYSPPLEAPNIQGQVEPGSESLSGSITKVEKDRKVGIIISHTYTWNLTR